MWQTIHPPVLSYPPSHLYYPVIHPISISLLFTLLFVLSSYPPCYHYFPIRTICIICYRPCHPYYLPTRTLCNFLLSNEPSLLSYYPCSLYYLLPTLLPPLSSYPYSLYYLLPTLLPIIFLSVLSDYPLPTVPSTLPSYQTFGPPLTLHAFHPQFCFNFKFIHSCYMPIFQKRTNVTVQRHDRTLRRTKWNCPRV